MQELRGGYGYIVPVAATVVKATPNRVVIEVTKQKTGETVRRTVKRESLREVTP